MHGRKRGKRMTNGEKLQEIFNVIVHEIDEEITHFYIAGIMYLTNTEWWNAEYKEPITKNDLGVDCVSRQAVDRLACKYLTKATDENIAFYEHFLDLPSVTPQEPKTGYISIDDAMSVFDDFMCGDISEEDAETFLEMLKDKTESTGKNGKID